MQGVKSLNAFLMNKAGKGIVLQIYVNSYMHVTLHICTYVVRGSAPLSRAYIGHQGYVSIISTHIHTVGGCIADITGRTT